MYILFISWDIKRWDALLNEMHYFGLNFMYFPFQNHWYTIHGLKYNCKYKASVKTHHHRLLYSSAISFTTPQCTTGHPCSKVFTSTVSWDTSVARGGSSDTSIARGGSSVQFPVRSRTFLWLYGFVRTIEILFVNKCRDTRFQLLLMVW